MFKRPPLRAASQIVNAPLALSVLFLLSACGGADQGQEPSPIDAPDAIAAAPETAAPEGLSIPAVWQTEPLIGEITSVAIADALGSTIAVTFKDGSLQLINFEGERITDPASLNAGLVANGRYLMLQDTPVTLFPAITRDGMLVSYIHGGELEAPIPYPLDAGTDETLIGICTAPPQAESDGVMRIGFWSLEKPNELKSGRIVEVGDNLIVLLDEPVTADVDIKACVLTDTGAQVYSEPALAAIGLKQRSREYLLTLDRAGGYALTNPVGQVTPFTVRDGITVRVPKTPTAMAGTGDARGGGYPNGLIVVGGQTPRGDQTITFVDPTRFTELELQ